MLFRSEKGLGGGRGGPSWSEDDESREVIAFASESVREPRTKAGFAGHFAAGHDEGACGVVVDGVGMDGLDHRKIIDDLGGVWEKFADPSARFTMLCEFEFAWGDRQASLAAGHGGDPLSFADGVGKVFVVLLFESGLVVPKIDLRGASIHVEVNEGFGFGREVWKSW